MKFTIEGRGYIEQDGKREYFKNHFFGNGLKALAESAVGGIYNSPDIFSWNSVYMFGISVGTNTSAPTTFNTSGCYSSVSILQNPALAISTSSNGSQFITTYEITFPVSALPAITIGELSLNINDNDTYFVVYGPISRASVADGDFAPFAYNPANALVVVWQLVFGFQ